MTSIKISAHKGVKFIVIFSLIMNCLIAEFKFPQSILYINDLVLLFLIVMACVNGRFNIFRWLHMSIINYVVLVLLLCILLSTIYNLVPPQLVLWGARNTFRGIIFFFLCTIYLTKNDVYKILDGLFYVQIINFIIGMYQYFILGLTQDRLGGLFGHGNGNALGIFCTIECSYMLTKSFNGEKKAIFKAIFSLMTSIVLAVLAEEKLMLFELVIAVLLCLALSKKSLIKLAIIPTIYIVGQQALQWLNVLFPGSTLVLTSTNGVTEYLTASWSGSYYIPRFGSFSFISNKIFHNNLFWDAFGLGMGNCDTSSFSFLQSPFYKQYGYMNYRWIFGQWTVMENGIVGFSLFLALFVVIIICLFKIRANASVQQKNVINISIITAVICIMTMWMNNTLKVDTAYIPYFAIASGFVCYKERLEIGK